MVVNDDTSDAGCIGDVGDRNYRNRHFARERRIFDLLGREAMALDEVVELCRRQLGFDPADQHGGEFVADLRHQHRDTVGALGVEIARKKIGAIVELPYRLPDAVFCGLRNGARQRRIGQNHGNRSWRKSKVFREDLEGDTLLARFVAELTSWGHWWRPDNDTICIPESHLSRPD